MLEMKNFENECAKVVEKTQDAYKFGTCKLMTHVEFCVNELHCHTEIVNVLKEMPYMYRKSELIDLLIKMRKNLNLMLMNNQELAVKFTTEAAMESQYVGPVMCGIRDGYNNVWIRSSVTEYKDGPFRYAELIHIVKGFLN